LSGACRIRRRSQTAAESQKKQGRQKANQPLQGRPFLDWNQAAGHDPQDTGIHSKQSFTCGC
jgi:hypothetical protein